jgi:hypothetical protein
MTHLRLQISLIRPAAMVAPRLPRRPCDRGMRSRLPSKTGAAHNRPETGSKVAWLDISLIKAGIVGHAPGTL